MKVFNLMSNFRLLAKIGRLNLDELSIENRDKFGQVAKYLRKHNFERFSDIFVRIPGLSRIEMHSRGQPTSLWIDLLLQKLVTNFVLQQDKLYIGKIKDVQSVLKMLSNCS